MPSSRYQPLIKNYDINERNIVNNQRGVFVDFVNKFNLNFWEKTYMELFKGVNIFAYGCYREMKGKVCCYQYKLKDIHNYFKSLFVNKQLLGNIIIFRPTLPYQHFVLDFDLKQIENCESTQKVNYDEYKRYVENERKNCSERYLMNNVLNSKATKKVTNFKIESEYKFNTNYFIYEIIYFLKENLGIDWLPIYILGKNGTFDRGFHIEIPDLIMSYHDIALLSHACHNFITNNKILDPIVNYSIFGCQKFESIDANLSTINEFQKTYLPYVKFYNNTFSTDSCDSFSSFDDTFDNFSIIKYKNCKNETPIYRFKILTMTANNTRDDSVLLNLLYNNSIDSNVDDDDTIPEYIKNDLNNKNNNDINSTSDKIFSLLKDDISSSKINNNNNDKFSFLVGNLEFPNILNYTNGLTLYKSILLDRKQDFETFENINKHSFITTAFIPADLISFININENNIKINIKEIAVYYTARMKSISDTKINFSTSFVSFHNINIYNMIYDDNSDENDNFQVFLYPFQMKHLLKLTFDEYDNRLCNTIFYLISIYTLSEKVKPLNGFIKQWLYDLGIKGKLKKFLNIFFILKAKMNEGLLKLDINEQNWAVLCLKHLLIRYNVLTFDEIYKSNSNNNNNDCNYSDIATTTTIANNNNNNIALIKSPVIYQNKPIKLGAVRMVKIPDVIMFSILNNSQELNELLALYCPIIRRESRDKRSFNGSGSNGGSNSVNSYNFGNNNNNNYNNNNNNFLLWNINNLEWISINLSIKNFFLISPEITQITKVIYNAREKEVYNNNDVNNKLDIRENESDNDENNDDKDEHLKNKSKKKCKRNNINNTSSNDQTKFNKILNENINQILIYWQDISARYIPNYFWKCNDCYFLLGGKDDRNNLIDILPLPMYIDNDSHDTNSILLNANEIKSYVNHIMDCKFIQNQFFPLVFKELYNNNDDNNKRKMKNIKSKRVKKFKNNDDDDDNDIRFRELVNAKRISKKLSLSEEINRELENGIINTLNDIYVRDDDDDDNDDDDIISHIWSYKLMLRNMTRYQYHCKVVDEFNESKLELVKLVKYFVIDQMCACYKDMKNAKVSQRILDKYIRGEYKNNREQQIVDLSKSLHKVLFSNPLSAQLSDIEPHEMTKVQCTCPVAKTFLYLLQTFSYDVLGMRYFLSILVSAICYGADVHRKELLVFLGDTNCGKTRLLKIIINVLDKMAGIISSRTSSQGTQDDRTHDIGKTADTARLWYIDEVGNRKYNREFFNQLTGNSPLFIRTNYSKGGMVKLAPTVFIFGNNSPIFNENCPALIERLRFYTFMAEFSFNQPVCFKYSKFPQISNFEKNQDHLTKGMMAILLHAICFSNSGSPFYLCKTIVDVPKNIKDSTIMYSPVINIVRELIHNCDLVEDPLGLITMKRIVYLINNLPDVLKSIRVATATDAIRFLDQIYPKSKIANSEIHCDNFYKDEDQQFTLVYLGLMERNIFNNNVKIINALTGITKRKKKEKNQ